MIEKDLQRFFKKVFINSNRMGGCWEWQACVTRVGYGQLKFKERQVGVHRLSYEHFNGSIPEGTLVLHKCDIRNCVNPSHLFLGTNQDNMNDKINKGRHAYGETSGQSKLTEAQVQDIYNASGTFRDIAKRYNISHVQVCNIKNKKTWKHIWK